MEIDVLLINAFCTKKNVNLKVQPIAINNGFTFTMIDKRTGKKVERFVSQEAAEHLWTGRFLNEMYSELTKAEDGE